MTVTYLSNVLNHHLFFIAQEFYKLLGDDFCFIETVENLNKGFDKGFAFMFADGENTDMPWLLKAYENEDLKRKCKKKNFKTHNGGAFHRNYRRAFANRNSDAV